MTRTHRARRPPRRTARYLLSEGESGNVVYAGAARTLTTQMAVYRPSQARTAASTATNCVAGNTPSRRTS